MKIHLKTPLVLFALLLSGSASASAVGPQLADLIFRDAPDDCEWHIHRTRFEDAWRLTRADGKEPGAGVVIAFPDTGASRHPELRRPDGSAPWADCGWDYLENDADPRDDLNPKDPIDFPGHATQALSVIVSPRGPATGEKGRFVTGAAPGARIMQLRVGRSVFITDPTPLAHAIRRAVDEGAHIILLARGAPVPSPELERELSRATERGVIVIAAAGNGVPFVVYPARLPGVIAVGASDYDDEPWTWSSMGQEVDVSAPGANVWAAYPYRDALGGNIRYLVKPAGGTTIAAALTASAAALWLSHHGRDKLLARYGPAGTAQVFRQLLRSTARTPTDWPTRTHGAGIVDAHALLVAELPAPTSVGLPMRKRASIGQHGGRRLLTAL